MSYFRPTSGAPRPPRKRGLGDAASDLWNAITGGGNASDDSGAPDLSQLDQTPAQSGDPATSTSQDSPTAGSGGWTTVGGTCYANNANMLGSMKALQRQLNRVAQTKSLPLISVDGAIGPATRSLMMATATMGGYRTMSNGNPSDCNNVCAQIFTFISATQAFADGLSAPTSVASPSPPSPPAIYNAQTKHLESQGAAAGLADAWNNLSSEAQIASMAGIAAVGLWAALDSKKSRKKR